MAVLRALLRANAAIFAFRTTFLPFAMHLRLVLAYM